MATGIEWTTETWNPVTGCDKVSQGCRFCYAETLAERLRRMGNPRYANGFDVTLHPDKIDEPRRWKKPIDVFVNSMSDLLHPLVPDDFLLRMFATMVDTPHTYQCLTKRPGRWASVTALVVHHFGRWPDNVYPGTSIESARHLDRLDALALAGGPGTIRMVSAEPLLGSLAPAGPATLADRLAGAGIGWVITGGEAGWNARPAAIEWFREIRDACALAAIPYFHKQHGGVGTSKARKRGGTAALLDGRLHHDLPARGDAQISLL